MSSSNVFRREVSGNSSLSGIPRRPPTPQRRHTLGDSNQTPPPLPPRTRATPRMRHSDSDSDDDNRMARRTRVTPSDRPPMAPPEHREPTTTIVKPMPFGRTNSQPVYASYHEEKISVNSSTSSTSMGYKSTAVRTLMQEYKASAGEAPPPEVQATQTYRRTNSGTGVGLREEEPQVVITKQRVHSPRLRSQIESHPQRTTTMKSNDSFRPPTASAPPRPPLAPSKPIDGGGSGFSPRPELPKSTPEEPARRSPVRGRQQSASAQPRRKAPQSSRRPPTQSVQTARARAQQRRRASSSSPGRRAHSASPQRGEANYFPGAKRIGDDDHVSNSTKFLLIAGTSVALISAFFVLRALYSRGSNSHSLSASPPVKAGSGGRAPKGVIPKVGAAAPKVLSSSASKGAVHVEHFKRTADIRDTIINNMKGIPTLDAE